MKTNSILVCLMIFGLFNLFADGQPNANQDTQISDKKPLVVIILGAPGSGKGTQAAKISQQLGIPHISTGDLFRENIKQQTALGNKASEYMQAGKLVPDELVLDMLFDRVSKPDAVNGYLLDGFPRTIPQAEALDARIGSKAKLVVLNLQVSDAEIMKRIAGRLAQANGNARPDDAPHVVESRLKVYHDQTEPVVGYYSKKGQLKQIDGEKQPNEVFEQLTQALKN